MAGRLVHGCLFYYKSIYFFNNVIVNSIVIKHCLEEKVYGYSVKCFFKVYIAYHKHELGLERLVQSYIS